MSENQDLGNWIYDCHKASLETLFADFSKVPDSKPSLTPILTRENQTCFGEFIEYKGVKTSYLGAFTKKEEEFLKSIYSQFNGSLEIRTTRTSRPLRKISRKKDHSIFSFPFHSL